MAHHNELEWLHDRGVQIDHKGRIIVSLPLPDDEVGFDSRDEEPSITELMRREVNARLSRSRGSRRRRAPKPAKHSDRIARTDDSARTIRIGRPAIGAEVRVYVQTSIAQTTRAILAKHGLTLAEVFDDCARGLSHGG
jgi:hypothetical protein